ncbi:MAG: hypothetical protein AAF705_21315, partial [Bacteroidota bacterium]
MKSIFSSLILLLFLAQVSAQQTFEVTIISDATRNEDHSFEENFKSEIEALLGSRFDLRFTEIYTGGSIVETNKAIEDAFSQRQTNVLVGIGILSSKLLSDQTNFPVPSIASVLLTNEQDQASSLTSNIDNYTYLTSPFNLTGGFEVLKEICDCSKIAVLTDGNLAEIGVNGAMLFSGVEAEIEWLSLGDNLSNVINQIPEDIGGVYLLSPLANYSPSNVKTFFDQLNERKLPSFTIFEDPLLSQGAYASFTTSDNIQKIPRRIALNIEKIAEDKNPKDFPVTMETFSSQLVVNMETVNK